MCHWYCLPGQWHRLLCEGLTEQIILRYLDLLSTTYDRDSARVWVDSSHTNIPCSETTLLLARSTLLATRITARLSTVPSVASCCRYSSAWWKLERSVTEYTTQNPCADSNMSLRCNIIILWIRLGWSRWVYYIFNIIFSVVFINLKV